MRFNWGRLPGKCGLSVAFSGEPCRPGLVRHVIGFGGRPRFVAPAQAGVQCLGLYRLLGGVLSAGGDWPGLAPAGDHLSCGDKKVDKETPPAAAPARAGALAPPEPGGSRRNSPSRAQTSTRQFPPALAAGCARRAEGKGYCRLGFAIAGGCRAVPQSWAWRSVTIRRPAQAGSRHFGLCRSVLGPFGWR